MRANTYLKIYVVKINLDYIFYFENKNRNFLTSNFIKEIFYFGR
jgi:hypothetical protein